MNRINRVLEEKNDLITKFFEPDKEIIFFENEDDCIEKILFFIIMPILIKLEKSKNPKSRPLLLLHGWPGSVIEFFNIIPRLAHPEKFGGKIEDGFDVIVPSLPGFGFSSRPARPIGPRKMSSIFNKR